MDAGALVGVAARGAGAVVRIPGGFFALGVGFIIGRVALGCNQLAGPVAPDAPYDGGCALDQAISSARLIRTADGSALVIPCPDAGDAWHP